MDSVSAVFITIGVMVFANESLVYVERLRINGNETPRRWGMWLLLPTPVLSLLASICFFVAAILNWCDYRSMQVTGIMSNSLDRYGDNVFKTPSDRFDGHCSCASFAWIESFIVI